MSRTVNRICAKCAASPIEEAKSQSCWVPSVCHRRRSHYRHRQQNNESRRQERRLANKTETAVGMDGQVLEVSLPCPDTLAAFLVFVRRNPTAPIHAIGAEIWQRDRLVARIPLQHTVGLRGPDLTAYLQQMQRLLRDSFGLERFEDTFIERLPEQCPIRPCPLHP